MKKNLKKIPAVTLSAVLTGSIVLSACGNQNSTTATEAIAETTLAETDADTEETEAESVLYENSEDGGHAIHADGETVSYDNISVKKTGDSEGDEADFYGENSAVFAENGANLTITNAEINTSGKHANAVFSYGEGTTVTISDSTIHTKEDTSGGIMTTGGGTTIANDLNVVTEGNSSAPIRSDRGGGTVTVNGGYYESNGTGSPAIYSTADITANDAELVSNVSQGVVVEGKNSVTLNNSTLTANNTKKNSNKSEYFQAVMLYQSMSGDADEGTAAFSMTDGSLTSLNGGMFFVTNTSAEIYLNNVTMNYASDDFLRISQAGWGSEGSNGGNVTFTAEKQKLEGLITVDEISILNYYLTAASDYSGAINTEGAAGAVYVELDEDSTWTLSGDSYITSLSCDEDAIDLNGYTLYVNGEKYSEGSASQGSAVEKITSASSEKSGDHKGKPGNDGGKSSGEKPSGKPGNGKSDEKKSGENSEEQGNDGQSSGEKSGDDKSGGKPSGDKPNGEKPSGQPKEDGQEPPEKPADGAEPPEKPADGAESPAKPSEESSSSY